MRLTYSGNILEPNDLVIPYGWSGDLAKIYSGLLHSHRVGPWTYFNHPQVGNLLGDYPNCWVWRDQDLHVYGVSRNTILEYGDLVMRCGIAGPLKVLCSNSDETKFLNGKDHLVVTTQMGLSANTLWPERQIEVWRRMKISKFVFTNSQDVLQSWDILTKHNFMGNPFSGNPYGNLEDFKNDSMKQMIFCGNSTLDEVEKVLQITDLIAWRNECKNNWVDICMVDDRARAGDVIVRLDSMPNLDAVTNTRINQSKLGIKIMEGSIFRGLKTSDVQKDFLGEIKIYRNVGNTNLEFKKFKRSPSKGNLLYSKVLPIP